MQRRGQPLRPALAAHRVSDATRWFLYMVRTRQGTLYTGISTDVRRRLAEHGGTRRGGAKYLKAREPLELAYQVEVGSRSTALRAEYRLKRLPRVDKQAIVDARPDRPTLLALLGVD